MVKEGGVSLIDPGQINCREDSPPLEKDVFVFQFFPLQSIQFLFIEYSSHLSRQ